MWEIIIDDKQPIYMSIVNHIEMLILNQKLVPHDALPSLRKLSDQLNINKDTVVSAYRDLESKGYVYKISGKGTFVKEFSDIEIDSIEQISDEYTYDFTQSIISTDFFPVEEFKESFDFVLTRDRGMAFINKEAVGYEPLRKEIHYLLKQNGVNTHLKNIMIISGAQQGIDLVSRKLLLKSDHVFIENPTYKGAYQYFKAMGVRITGIPFKDNDLDLEVLERELKWNQPKLFYAMPNYQNPTGYSYSKETQKKLLQLAEEHDFFIIEDDYTNDINYGHEVNRLKSNDIHERVIYIKSFSKILTPGLRVSFIVIPDSLIDALENIKAMTDISTSGILQRTLANFISSDNYTKHIDKINDLFKERIELTKHYLDDYMPKGVSYDVPEGGISFWIKLPPEVDAETLYKECKKADLIFNPGSDFYINQQIKGLSYIRLSLGGIELENIEDGIKILSRNVLKCIYHGQNKMIIY